jgi:hypothetical protein
MSIETMTKLGTVTVDAGGSATIAFSSIPQTYTDLVLKISARASGSGAGGINCYWVINGGFDMTSRWLNGSGSAVSAAYRTDGFTIEVDGATQTASIFSNGEFYIPNYTSSNYKTYSLDNVIENNATAANMTLLAGLRSNSEPIRSIEIVCGSGTFVQHTKATLYGVKAMRKSVGSSIKATGGAISFDGTYVVHSFNATGVFTPTSPILVDYLVVAGGGGGGTSYGAGGGAGGLRCTVGATGGGGSLESRLSLNPQSYVVTVGAGGSNGSAGSNSVFSSITSTGGGVGGSGSAAGGAGGSGGGAGGNSGTTGGTGTANQGYNGGAGAASGGGGGGGAGSAGFNATTNAANSAGGYGGSGLELSIGGRPTFYAGGGGGYGQVSPGYGGSLIGGNGSRVTNAQASTNGRANTGSGGGGEPSGAGGSGIVIVRYKA